MNDMELFWILIVFLCIVGILAFIANKRNFICYRHVCYLDELKRRDDGMVECQCIKCNEWLVANYGLALDCDWLQRGKL